jgi:hypothetical protein
MTLTSDSTESAKVPNAANSFVMERMAKSPSV